MSNWDYILSTPQKGWECPRCGRILAPWMPNCSCEKQRTFAYTEPESTTTTTINIPPKEHSYSMSICDSCKYINVPFTHYPCSNCYDHEKYVKWSAE